MGYGYYEIETPDGKPMKRGYSVSCKCHARGCKEKIDRGLAYLCYFCTLYFCGSHRTWADKKGECFAGESDQACLKCAKEVEQGETEDVE